MQPYRGADQLNYLCILAVELLGIDSLSELPAIVSGFDSISNTLAPNVRQAVLNLRMSGIAPATAGELRIFVEQYLQAQAERDHALRRQPGSLSAVQGVQKASVRGAADVGSPAGAAGAAGSRSRPAAASPAASYDQRFDVDERMRVRRRWTSVMPADVSAALQSMTSVLAPEPRPSRSVHDARRAAVAKLRGRHEGEAIDIDPLDRLPPAPPVMDVARVGRAPGLVRWADLVAVAQRYDEADVLSGRQVAGRGSWYSRLHDSAGIPTAVLERTTSHGLQASVGLELVGVKHLIGLPGAGKTTLLLLLAGWLAERGYRAAFLFPSIQVAAGFIETLAPYGVDAALLYGQTDKARTAHVVNFAGSLAQQDRGFAQTRTTAGLFATNCTLAAFASSGHESLDHDSPPCQSIEQARSSAPAPSAPGARAAGAALKFTDGPKTRLHRCALSSVCGRQRADRALVSAQIWAGHVLSLNRELSPLFSDTRLRHFELLALGFDLVVIDECDSAQAALDRSGTPVLRLSGNSESVWSRLIMDIHAPAARGQNAFVARRQMPNVLEMSARFGTAAERLTSAILSSAPRAQPARSGTRRVPSAVHEATRNRLLTTQVLLAEMFELDTERDEHPGSQLPEHFRRLSAIERLWDMATKPVAFRSAAKTQRDLDEQETDEGYWSSEADASAPNGGAAPPVAGDGSLGAPSARLRPTSTREQIAKALDKDVEWVDAMLGLLTQAVDAWDREPGEEQVARLAKLLAQIGRECLPGTNEQDQPQPGETFFGLCALLVAVTMLVLQSFGISPIVRWLNAQGLLGGEVFDARPPAELLGLVSEALVGRLRGVRYTLSDDGDVDLQQVEFAGTPRLMVSQLHKLANAGSFGPAVLLTSATSMLEQSPQYHVDYGPHYVLRRPNAGAGWERSRYFFRPLANPSSPRTKLVFSGSPIARRESVLSAMVDQLLADGELGVVAEALRQNDVQDGVHRRAAFVVNSYDQARLVFERIRAHHPGWAERVRYVARAGASGAQHAGSISAAEVESLGSDDAWDILVFPMAAIGRGVNIVFASGPRRDQAMIGSVFFLVRPHPSASSLDFLQGLIGQRSQRFAKREFASLAQALDELRTERAQTSQMVRRLLRMTQSASTLGRHAEAFVADQMIMILQTIGRAMRGDCPAFVYFVDAAWAPRSAQGKSDTAASSMLVMMREILEKCLDHPSLDKRACYESLYAGFHAPLSRIDGLISAVTPREPSHA